MKTIKPNLKVVIATLLVLAVGAAFWLLIRNNDFAVLQPAGNVADEQRHLIIFASALSALIVVPVFAMTFWIVWKYRATNQTAGTYRPEFQTNRLAETIWWGVPLGLIIILAIVIWVSSHRLDPYRPLQSSIAPLKVQVVALQWKWLFIYPELGIASVNELRIPVDRPIDFQLTSDAPMNSFWIPKLGGQVYAMSGMSTQLHLQAHTPGRYTGRSTNIDGEGYSDMTFKTVVTVAPEFGSWVGEVRTAGTSLTTDSYDALAAPSIPRQAVYYSTVSRQLYDTVVMKYMAPSQPATPLKPGTPTEHHE